jgi:hypothetical protein
MWIQAMLDGRRGSLEWVTYGSIKEHVLMPGLEVLLS